MAIKPSQLIVFLDGTYYVIMSSGGSPDGGLYTSEDWQLRYEAAILWKALDISPKIGTELLFDIAIDDSLDGKRRECQLMWNGSGGSSGDRSYWGRLRLAGQ